MPPVVAFLTSIFTAIGFSAATAGALAVSTLLTGASLVIGQVTKLFAPKPSSSASLASTASNRQITSRQAISPRRVAYGSNNFGGIITFMAVSGSSNQLLHLVITLTGHRVSSIPTMYFDGVAVPLNGSGDCVSGTFNGLVHAEFNLGSRTQAAFAGLVAASVGWTSSYRQRGCAGVYVQLTWNQNVFPNGVPNITFDCNGRDQVYDPRTGTMGYSTNAALCIADYLNNAAFGLASQTRAGLVSTMFSSSGLGSFSAANSCDGDVTTTAWSTNAASSGAFAEVDLGSGSAGEFRRCRFYLDANGYLGSYNVEYSDNNSTWTAAATGFVPDVVGWNDVELAPNGAHRYWRVKLTNTPGAGPNIKELEFWSSDIDSPTLVTAANTCDELVSLLAGGSESRYTVNGSFTTDQRPADIIGQMNTAQAGSVAYISGKWGIYPGTWRGSSLNLGDGDLRAPITVQTRRTHRDLINGVKGTFLSPTNNWQLSDFPPYSDPSYVYEDANELLWSDVEYPFTISAATAQRISKINLRRNRHQISLQGQFKLTAYQVQPMDIVQLTHSRFGWSNKTFEVETCNLVYAPDASGAAMAVGVDLTLNEVDSTIYDWSTADENSINTPPTSILPNNASSSAPTSLALASGQITRAADGVSVAAIVVTWVSPLDQFVKNGGAIVVQFKKHTDVNWITNSKLDGAAVTDVIAPVIDGTQYDVQIWAENVSGVKSAIVNSTIIPSATQLLIDTIGDGSNFYRPPQHITLPTDLPENASFEIFPDGQDTADTWTKNYWASGGATYARSNVPFSGNYAQNIIGGNLAGTVASKPFGVKPGLQYNLRARVKASATNIGDLYIRAAFFSDDSDLTITGWAAQGSMYQDIVAHYTTNSTSWTLWEGQVTVPATAKFCRIVLFNWNGGSAGTLSFDTVGWALFQLTTADTATGSTSFPSTTSTTYAVIPEMSITKNVFGGKAQISAQMSIDGASNVGSNVFFGYVAIFRDGSQLTPDLQFGMTSGTAGESINFPTTLTWIDDSVSAGSHTWDIRWKISASSLLIEQNCRKMQVEEIT
jgi:hypothetical protein